MNECNFEIYMTENKDNEYAKYYINIPKTKKKTTETIPKIYMVVICKSDKYERYNFIISLDMLIEKIKKYSCLIKIDNDIINVISEKWNSNISDLEGNN